MTSAESLSCQAVRAVRIPLSALPVPRMGLRNLIFPTLPQSDLSCSCIVHRHCQMKYTSTHTTTPLALRSMHRNPQSLLTHRFAVAFEYFIRLVKLRNSKIKFLAFNVVFNRRSYLKVHKRLLDRQIFPLSGMFPFFPITAQ